MIGTGTRRPLHIAYVTVAGGGGETYVREQARALSGLGHRVSILHLHHSPTGGSTAARRIVEAHSFFGPTATPEQSDSVSEPALSHLDYVAPTNLHYYYGRLTASLPRHVRLRLPSKRAAKGADMALSLRRALRRVARAAGRIDVVEYPDHAGIVHRFLPRRPPYAVKLHSSTPDWRHFCGPEMSEDDRHTMRVERDLLLGARLLHSPSVHMADHVSAFYGIPREQIHVVPYPLDIERFTPETTDLPTHSSNGARREGQTCSVLYVGRLDPMKGLDTLARAAELIFRAQPNSVIDVIGGDSNELGQSNIRSLIPAVYQSRISFHGRVPRGDLPAYYRRAAVCVVPSCWESFCYTAAEALACGTPVVASDAGALPELVLQGKTGMLVPRGDAKELANAVIQLLRDPVRRSYLGNAGHEHVARKCEPRVVACQAADLYYDILARRGGDR